MSSRQLRKLQQQRELEQAKLREQNAAVEQEDDEDEEEDDEVHAPSSKPSLFANFAALQDEAEVDDDDENAEEEEEDKPLATSDMNTEKPSSVKKSKKSKKKKKKAKGNPAKDGDPVRYGEDSDKNLDEIDAALKELNVKSHVNKAPIVGGSESPLTTLDISYRRTISLLQISTQHLKVANEMKNLFGRSALENHDGAGGQVPGGARRRQQGRQVIDLETALKGRHLPGRGFPEVTLRRNIFIQGKDDWPRGTTGGLSMENLVKEHSNGAAEFTFVHDASYQTVQQQFNMLVEMGDPQNLIGLLQRNPYHVSSLLQVSKVAKDQGDHALSSDLVERALFTFARATTSLFASSLSQGLARLQFARRENREFWLAGYQYIKSLVMKGTHRTALEWAKILLAVDVNEKDPYCMLLMIHHLALRAHEFEWLLELSESSVWKNATIPGEDGNAYASHITPSLAFAALQLKDGVRCRSLLTKSVQELPWLFCKLFQELGLDNVPPSIWGAQPRTDAENLFTDIYIRQTKDLWNTPEATALLVEVAETTGKLSEKDIPKTHNSTITLDVARFVYLDNTPALMALVPSRLLHRTNNSDSDPLPPTNDLDGPEGLHTFYDPVAALRQLLPGWTGDGGAEDERAIANAQIRGLQEAREGNRDRASDAGSANDADEGDDDESVESEEDNAEGPPRLGATGWLYSYLFGSRNQAHATDPTDEEESLRDDGDAADTDEHPHN